MTNIALMPAIVGTATTSQDGDCILQIGFQNSGAAIDLTGIGLTLNWKLVGPNGVVVPNQISLACSTAGNYLTNGNITGVVFLNVPALKLSRLAAGTYQADLVATVSTETLVVGTIVFTHNVSGPCLWTSLTTTVRNAATANSIGYIPGPGWNQYKNNWSSTASYITNDVVYSGVSTWIATQSSTNQVPGTGSAYWNLVAPGVDPTSLNNATASAASSASAAANSASSAATSQAAASGSAGAAAASQTAAGNSASGAANQATAASASATLAQAWAVQVGSEVSSIDWSAKEWAIGTDIRGVAGGGSSKDWSCYLGGAVDGTNYSAAYNAGQAALSATAAASSATAAASSATSAANSAASVSSISTFVARFAGSIIPFSGSGVPNASFYVADGSLKSRTTDANLWAYAQNSGNLAASDTAWTSGQYSPGDGSSTFRIPKLGGYFLRALDNGAGIDPSRAVGTIQADALQGHEHSYQRGTGASPDFATVTSSGGEFFWQTASSNTGAPVSDGTNGTPRTAAETRPVNIAYIFCIHRGL